MKKTVFLLVTLAIPVVVFLFLKIFGENRYDVPVYFENGIPDCTNISQPHIVNRETLALLPDWEKTSAYGVMAIVQSMDKEENRALFTELVRIQDAFYGKEVPQFILLTGNMAESDMVLLIALSDEVGLMSQHKAFSSFDGPELLEFARCQLGLEVEEETRLSDLVLVDQENKIRGFYPVRDPEQTDRLILELKILKNQN